MRLRAPLLALATVVAAACSQSGSPPSPTASAPSPLSSSPGAVTPSSTAQAPPPGLETLDHLIFIVQENRSFDHYFGTFPGADGIKFSADGTPKACIPDPVLGHCSRPYASSEQIQLQRSRYVPARNCSRKGPRTRSGVPCSKSRSTFDALPKPPATSLKPATAAI